MNMNDTHPNTKRLNQRLDNPVSALEADYVHREIAASANRIDMIIAVFAFGTWIA